MKFQCPACGAAGQFTSGLSAYYTCPYCRNQIFRNQDQLENLGKVAELPIDMSPLQIYSQGEINKKTFTILGRAKYQWEEGQWNEWFLGFNDGSNAWLAEAQGEFIYSVQIHDIKVPAFSEKSIGDNFTHAGALFTYTDYKESVSYGFEGELPFKISVNESRRSIDLLSTQTARFLSFESDAAGARAYLGQYITLQDLKMKNLRRFDGWSS